MTKFDLPRNARVLQQKTIGITSINRAKNIKRTT